MSKKNRITQDHADKIDHHEASRLVDHFMIIIIPHETSTLWLNGFAISGYESEYKLIHQRFNPFSVYTMLE
jgi:hypothetical protein